jgi:hypothetical protein
MLTACGDTAQERLDELTAEADIDCWTYYCPGTQPGPPSVPIEDVVACMNDALASGARARASWGAEDFGRWTYEGTRVFTVDHRIVVFSVKVVGPTSEGDIEVHETQNCAGPFGPGNTFCAATYSLIEVKDLAWDGCD